MQKKNKIILIGDSAPVDWDDFVKNYSLPSYMGLDQHISCELKLNNKFMDPIDLVNYAIETDINSSKTGEIINRDQHLPLGSVIIYQHLIKNNFEVELIRNFQLNKNTIKSLLAEKPLAILLSTKHLNIFTTNEILTFIQKYKHPETHIILGGYFAWTLANATLENILDKELFKDTYIIIDKCGIKTLTNLLNTLNNNNPVYTLPANIITLDNSGNFKRTQIQKEECDINDHIVSWQNIPESLMTGIAPARISDGCPFRCAFCVFWTNHPKSRFLTKDNLILELCGISKHSKTNHIFTTDECINISIDHLKDFCNVLISNNIEIGWSGFFRTKPVDKELVKLMKDSGCKFVSLGIESFDDEILINMNKKVKSDDHFRCIEMFKNEDIGTLGTFCVGFPGETEKSIEKTIKGINNSGVDLAELYGFTYFKEAPVESMAKEYDLKGNIHYWSHKTMNSQELYSGFIPSTASQIENIGVIEWDNWGIVSTLFGNGLDFQEIKNIYSTRRQLIRLQEKQESFNNLDYKIVESYLNVLRKIR